MVVLDFESTVVIMRNPFESMVSYRKLEVVGKIENPEEMVAFNTSKWHSFKSTEIGSWYKHAVSYLKHPNNKMHVIQYDDLVSDTRKGKLFQWFYLFNKFRAYSYILWLQN
jgi:hypothetical protein